MIPGNAEFGFELLTCRWAEQTWPPGKTRAGGVIVGRQVGTRDRRWDTIILECDPDGLAERRVFGDQPLDSDLLRIIRHAPPTWQWYREAIPEPDFPWRYVREAIHRAADRNIVSLRKQSNRVEIKQIAQYPDWLRRIIAIENKPDMDASAARNLGQQLSTDVDSQLADEVWVATKQTDNQVEPALLEDIPIEAGILSIAFDPHASDTAWTDADVLWQSTELARDHPPDRRRQRLILAERVYGRGWRSYHRTMRPDCRHFELRRYGDSMIPWCQAKQQTQTAAECSSDCRAFEPEPPTWRTHGWPIEGGPGKGIKWLLARRRERARARAENK